MSRAVATLPKHEHAPLGQIHPTPNWSFADLTARDAKVDFVVQDVGADCQVGDDTAGWVFYKITQVNSGVATWIKLGSGLVNFSEQYNNSSPNDTISSVQLTPNVVENDADFVITPKGNGAIVTQIPDNSINGNKRGNTAVDLQLVRYDASQVASGVSSFAVGEGNTADGYCSKASGLISDTKGIVCIDVHAPASHYAHRAQAGKLPLAANTISGRPRVLTSNNTGTVGADNQLILKNNQAVTFTGKVIAKRQGSTDIASWTFSGCIVRGANAASTSLPVAATITTIINQTSCILTISADTTNGGLKIEFTDNGDEHGVSGVIDFVEVF